MSDSKARSLNPFNFKAYLCSRSCTSSIHQLSQSFYPEFSYILSIPDAPIKKKCFTAEFFMNLFSIFKPSQMFIFKLNSCFVYNRIIWWRNIFFI